jgi:neurotransmitter:Na+ symporter, NSS family
VTLAIPVKPPCGRSVTTDIGARWSSPGAFVSAAVMSVGLANVWRVPYLISRHGGGAFLLVYVLALLLLAFPVLMAEVIVGCRGRSDPAQCFGTVARDEGRTWLWRLTGIAGSLAGLMLLGVYSVSASWVITLLSRLAVGERLAPVDLIRGASGLGAMIGSPWPLVVGQVLMIGVAVRVAAQGLRFGLEPIQGRLLLTLLPILAILLGLCSIATDQLGQAIEVVFMPDFARLGWRGICEAVRLAFLTLGLGVGTMTSFGAALPEGTSIFSSTVKVIGLALLVTLTSTVAIFSILLAGGGFPDRGPALLFVVIPATLSGLPAGGQVAAVFYGFLLLALLGSALAVLHPLVEHLVRWTRMPRSRAAMLAGGMACLIGAIAIAPRWLGRSGAGQWVLIEWMGGPGVDLLLPAATLGGALFVGWAMSRRTSRAQLALPAGPWFVTWRWLIRFPVPFALAAVVGFGVLECFAG